MIRAIPAFILNAAAYWKQFGILNAAPIPIKSAVLSADAIVYSGPCLLLGVKVIIAGTSIDIHDALSAVAGTEVIDGEATTTLGAFLTPCGGAMCPMDTGIYMNLTGGSYRVYYIPTK